MTEESHFEESCSAPFQPWSIVSARSPVTSGDLTPENLDRIAKALQKELLTRRRLPRSLVSRAPGVILWRLVEHVEDGNDVIIQAKLGDQLPRMFEKMLDNVTASAVQTKRERAKAIRNDIGIAITPNTIEQYDAKLERFRVQWWTLNEAFKVARGPVRQHRGTNASFGVHPCTRSAPKLSSCPRGGRADVVAVAVTPLVWTTLAVALSSIFSTMRGSWSLMKDDGQRDGQCGPDPSVSVPRLFATISASRSRRTPSSSTTRSWSACAVRWWTPEPSHSR